MVNGETDIERRVRVIEVSCGTRGAEFDTMTETVKDHERRLREVEKLMPALRGALWALTALAGSGVALIWALITGQAAIVFR